MKRLERRKPERKGGRKKSASNSIGTGLPTSEDVFFDSIEQLAHEDNIDVDPALLYALRKTCRMLTERNVYLLSADELASGMARSPSTVL